MEVTHTGIAAPDKQTKARRSSTGGHYTRRDIVAGYMFILPSIIGFALFVVYPLIATFILSLTKWDGLTAPVFIGLQNFQYMLFKDPSFWPTIRATFGYVLIFVPGSLAVGLGLALLLNRKLIGVQIFRVIFYLPAVLPLVATITLWKYIFNVRFGMANAILRILGLPQSLWFGDPVAALVTMSLIGVWGIGTTIVIFLAALQSVPKELYEAAQIDGAGSWDLFRRITLPNISPILFLQLINLTIVALQEFNRPKILTEGEPNNATNLLMYNIYKRGFGNLSANPDLGYAISQVVILFLIIVVFTVLTFRLSGSWVQTANTLD